MGVSYPENLLAVSARPCLRWSYSNDFKQRKGGELKRIILLIFTFALTIGGASTAQAVDQSIPKYLKNAGINPTMVNTLGALGDVLGYGISPDVAMTYEQRQSFAVAIVIVCRDIRAGRDTWTHEIASDISSGGSKKAVLAMNGYLKKSFCPKVRN